MPEIPCRILIYIEAVQRQAWGPRVVKQKKQSMVALLWVFNNSVLFSAFQQILKLLASPLLRRFSTSWKSPPILQHCPAVIAPPAFMFAAAVGCPPPVPASSGSPFHYRPTVGAGPPIHAGSTVNAASAVLPAAPLRDVLCIGKASPIEADAPSAIVAQVVCQVNVAHNEHQKTKYRENENRKLPSDHRRDAEYSENCPITSIRGPSTRETSRLVSGFSCPRILPLPSQCSLP
jgi:hypothetical protein